MENLLELKKACGKSYQQIADECGVEKSVVYRYVNSQRKNLDPETLQAILKAIKPEEPAPEEVPVIEEKPIQEEAPVKSSNTTLLIIAGVLIIAVIILLTKNI